MIGLGAIIILFLVSWGICKYNGWAAAAKLVRDMYFVWLLGTFVVILIDYGTTGNLNLI